MNILRKGIRFWLRYISPHVETLIATVGIAGLGICLLLLWIVAKLSKEVWEREAFAFDTSFLLWLHQFSSLDLDNIMLFITKLGNPEIVLPIAFITLVILVWKRQRREAQMFMIVCLGGTILNTGLKLIFGKPRPALWDRLITETTYSFPSGHALGSVVLYGAIAYLLVQSYPQFSQIIYAFAAALILAICLSRLYLGVHWLTDIIAGVSIGFLWLTLCITMLKLRKLKRV